MESTAVELNALTTAEKSELEALEKVVDRGMKSFFEVGSALIKIRDGRLYRQAHDTFEDYCRVRWGMSRPRAYQLIDAAKVKDSLSTMVDISERQARPLTRLEPEQQRVVWQEAVETAPDGKVTAKHVENVVHKLHGKKSEAQVVESPNLYNLKTMWNACNGSDRARFMKWITEYFPKYIH